MPHTNDATHSEICRLCQQGMLGFFNRIEITEIIAFPEKGQSPINVFTLMVVEESGEVLESQPTFLNKSRISLPSLRKWSFGIVRYTRRIADLDAIVKDLGKGVWRVSGESLGLGVMEPILPQFVPPDSASRVPLNRVLKNNFWNGSYVFEWADTEKFEIQPLFAHPLRLQELSSAIAPLVPIRLGSLSDRVGNIVLQCPSAVLMAKFARLNSSGEWVVQIGWHPRATPRALRAACEVEFDHAVLGYSSCPIDHAQTHLSIAAQHGLHRGFIWDDVNSLTLAATGPSAFITTVGLRLGIVDPEPRVFTTLGADGTRAQHRVQIVSINESLVGRIEGKNETQTRQRMYHDETARLSAERQFVQYKPQPGRQWEEHQKALSDLRLLVNQHGENGAWLWDPYLSARDILNTLFHCNKKSVDLRGLTASLVPPADGAATSGENYLAAQQREFIDAQSNFHGLRLEFRRKVGPAGWDFHDRFLIFPGKSRGALAWSLGTSVNSLGKQHHILQRVDDGQRVMDAFAELWNQLDKPEHLIWKTP